VPLFKGGADSRENMQALCNNCHAEKSVSEWSRDRQCRAAKKLSAKKCEGCGAIVSTYFAHTCTQSRMARR
jgi:hypothetical protein